MTNRMIIVTAIGVLIETEHDGPLDLKTLQDKVGGHIETVPYLTEYDGERCVAYCNEYGKVNGLAFNPAATDLWHKVTGYTQDVLLGDVVILVGDDKFLGRTED